MRRRMSGDWVSELTLCLPVIESQLIVIDRMGPKCRKAVFTWVRGVNGVRRVKG